MNRKDTIWATEKLSKRYLENMQKAIPFRKEQIQIFQKITRSD